jgi:hypothetical protein
MQATLGAPIINVFFGAVDLHMRNASAHRPRGASTLKKAVQAISAAASRADRATPASRFVRDLESDSLAQTTASLSEQPADGLVGARAPHAPEALRRRYARAYAGAIEMANRTNFVAGQRIIRRSAVPLVSGGAIQAPATGPRGEVDDDGIAAALQSDPTGLREDEMAEIRARRATYGRRLADALRAAAPMNRYTPKI